MKTNVLIIGSGGREHALAWKVAQSPRLGKLFVAPGTAGTALIAENVPIAATGIEALAHFAKDNNIQMTIVGPDDPLAAGVVDVFHSNGLRIFGPTKAAAEIEWSKGFAKDLMHEAGIPTATSRLFQDKGAATAYAVEIGLPHVIKANGLALGKGVFVCRTLEESQAALRELPRGDIIVETFLEGEEISLHAFCDGKHFSLFPASRDHKALGEGNTGKNTGGVGAIAPVASPVNDIVRKTLDVLTKKGRGFMGCLYPGLMMTSHGPMVLEYNARFGDPEAQVYMRLLKTDFLDIVDACIDGTLNRIAIQWNSGYAACIVLVSGGYPDVYKIGFPISGIEDAEKIQDVMVFHAGTKRVSGELRTAGGRVLGVSAIGATPDETLQHAYEGVAKIHFQGMYFRKDIGK